MVEKKSWGRPKGSKLSEETKKQISKSVHEAYLKQKVELENEVIRGELNKGDGAEGE